MFLITLFSIIIVSVVSVYIFIIQKPTTYNPESKNKIQVSDQIVVNSINTENRSIDLEFGYLEIQGNKNFSAYLLTPDGNCQFFENGTKEQGSQWYVLIAKNNADYPKMPLMVQIDPSNLIGGITYYTEFYIVLEGSPNVTYTEGSSLHPVFAQTLTGKEKIWTPEEKVEQTQPDAITNYCNPYAGKPITILHHKILLHSWLDVAKTTTYYAVSIMLPILVAGHYRWRFKNNNVSTHAVIFLGTTALFFSLLFGIQQTTGPLSNIFQIILTSSMIVYVVMFLSILRRNRRNYEG